MAKIRNMPAPWKRAHPAGYYYIPFGEGYMIFSPAKQEWWFSVRRGKSPFEDRWGPWHGAFDELETITKEMKSWEAAMRRAGWFRMKLSKAARSGSSFTQADCEVMERHTSRLPRCEYIPLYLLVPADKALAARGKAQTSKCIRVGGLDVVNDTIIDWWEPKVNSTVDISFRQPGGKRYSPGTRRMNLDVPSLDALVSFLLDVRSQMVSNDAREAVHAQGSQAARHEDIRTRFRQRVEAGEEVSALFKELKDATTGQVATIRAMAQMILAGDMEVELLYAGTDEERGDRSHLH
ncbi:hypothetical protein [Rhizobium sp. MHM7A]|uniref:hypothetical protein n=1 Tax=Rhizobium sp. MHM7A TaxID=2583233 RepID=UPI001107318F|nr:hypothetical protein [Rhizobium sp. MHM7A]TLX16110.1 hypothetical protein FFR93_01955 [Rhizobium sp. MHM7A]